MGDVPPLPVALAEARAKGKRATSVVKHNDTVDAQIQHRGVVLEEFQSIALAHVCALVFAVLGLKAVSLGSLKRAIVLCPIATNGDDIQLKLLALVALHLIEMREQSLKGSAGEVIGANSFELLNEHGLGNGDFHGCTGLVFTGLVFLAKINQLKKPQKPKATTARRTESESQTASAAMVSSVRFMDESSRAPR